MKLAQFFRTNPFDGALCSDRHKHRRIEHAMSRCYPAAARFRFAILRNEFKHRESHSHIVQAWRTCDFVSGLLRTKGFATAIASAGHGRKSVALGWRRVLKKTRDLCAVI